MSPIAAMPGLLLVVLMLVAPTIVVLLWLSVRFAASSNDRLTNIACGFACAIVAIVAIVALEETFKPVPNSWVDRNYPLFYFAVAPFGAALGVAVATSGRYVASRLRARFGR